MVDLSFNDALLARFCKASAERLYFFPDKTPSAACHTNMNS